MQPINKKSRRIRKSENGGRLTTKVKVVEN